MTHPLTTTLVRMRWKQRIGRLTMLANRAMDREKLILIMGDATWTFCLPLFLLFLQIIQHCMGIVQMLFKYIN